MSPKAANYKANSIVYFKGDINDRIYLLKAGRVVLKYNDIETGQELQDLIRLAETFGFFLVHLDVRQESTRHTDAVAEIGRASCRERV